MGIETKVYNNQTTNLIGDKMGIETKVYNNQTTIPAHLRKKESIDNNTIVEWIEKEDNTYEVKFRKKRTFKEMLGKYSLDEPTNSVELKKELYK